jgi:CRP-like cAMP-binding protein
MDKPTHLAQRPPLLWDAPVEFVLWSLEEAKVQIAERRYEAGQTIYYRGEPDRYLYFLTKGVLKIYKSYGGHKEAIVTLLEEDNVFGVPDLRARGAHCDSAQAVVRSRIAVVEKVALADYVRRDYGQKPRIAPSRSPKAPPGRGRLLQRTSMRRHCLSSRRGGLVSWPSATASNALRALCFYPHCQ